MEDKEILEWAAKAVGFKGRWVKGFEHLGLCEGVAPTMLKVWWNPLQDDGDALRLAITLKFSVTIFNDAIGIGIKDRGYREYPFEDYIYKATRVAITLAAAEIGKAMP